MKPVVYVVHCIDTEGPLYESVEATFERIRHAFHLDLAPNRETLRRLQAGEMRLGGGLDEAVSAIVNPRLLAYNDSWEKIDAMLEEVMDPAWRAARADSFGRGWVFNWFCMDHVDYDNNPRRRDMGYHNIFNHYSFMLRELDAQHDGLHFHYHPHDFTRSAHVCATHWWANSNSLHQVIARRIIDHGWFPSAHRPGFHTTRPDSHWFLEQHIPFDFANQASDESDELQFDLAAGRNGDWRRAPRTWVPYHPDHDDYQIHGNCRRVIARCLNIGTRSRNLSQPLVDQAFREARQGKGVVLAFADHDWRHIGTDVDTSYAMIHDAATRYPDVAWKNCEAVEAMRGALGIKQPSPPCDLTLKLAPHGSAHRLIIRSAVPTFGPQPFLAIKTTAGTYLHDNLDFQRPGLEWTYVLDTGTLPLRAVESIGVGACSRHGTASTAVLDTTSGSITRRTWEAGRRPVSHTSPRAGDGQKTKTPAAGYVPRTGA